MNLSNNSYLYAMEELNQTVTDYIETQRNGILQHTPEWLRAKRYTFGGSEKSVLDGNNPYSSMYKTICIKVGIDSFGGDIKTQWGNVFEYLLRTYTEITMKTQVQGHELFIRGPEPFSYSPDGIGVVKVRMVDNKVASVVRFDEPHDAHKIMLFEFKCPYSRIPNGKVPKYYLPQIKQGLDIINICEAGVFIEGVFRRCAWDQLGNNAEYDVSLVKAPPSGKHMPLAYGVIGFYSPATSPYRDMYEKHFEYGDESNDYLINDLGDCSNALMVELFDAFGRGDVEVWYGEFVIVTAPATDAQTAINDTHMDQQVFDFIEFCKKHRHISYGFLPWKLLTYTTNIIHREPDYLAPSIPKAREIINVVKKCDTTENIDEKRKIIAKHLMEPAGFEDYWD